jgi:hypothetical protein
VYCPVCGNTFGTRIVAGILVVEYLAPSGAISLALISQLLLLMLSKKI